MWSVCCWWLVYSLTWPESDWLDSGWVGLHTCGAWAAIMAPRINQPSTHTLEEEPQPWQLYHQLGEYHLPNLQKNILYYHLPVSCVRGLQGEPRRWRVEEQPCHRRHDSRHKFFSMCWEKRTGLVAWLDRLASLHEVYSGSLLNA